MTCFRVRTRAWRAIAALMVWIALVPAARTAAANEAAEKPREAQLGERVLALGSWGADVFTLQRHLRSLGYDLAADGLYGRETRAVVMRFQEEHNLPATGRVDQATLEALNRALLAAMATDTYVVQPGDSLWSIARAYDTTMATLVELNDLPDRPLRVGEVLKVPALAKYTVKPGDTLWGIAVRFKTTVAALAELNDIDPEGVLRVGTVLRLPRGAVALTPAE